MPAAARRYLDLLWLSQTDPDVVERLNAFRPKVLTGYAGVLEILALEAEAGRLRLAPELRQVVNNSEALTDRAKARIESAFGLHVMNNYATGECPFLSNGCHTDDGAHVNADWAILEVVDDEYRPVPDGTPGQQGPDHQPGQRRPADHPLRGRRRGHHGRTRPAVAAAGCPASRGSGAGRPTCSGSARGVAVAP